MNQTKLFASLVFLAIFSIISCEKDDPIIPNEEEVITTLIYTLTPEIGGNPVIMSFLDLDGDGGNNPVLTAQDLEANTTYNGVLELLNEQETPAESISDEVDEEADEHQFFFESNVDGLVVTYSDEDSNGNPLGLKTILKTGSAQSGQLTITLRHEPDKSASGVSDGVINNAGGETDIEVTFDVQIN